MKILFSLTNYLRFGDSSLMHEPSGHVYENISFDDVRTIYEVSFKDTFDGEEFTNSALLIAKNNGDLVGLCSTFRVWRNQYPQPHTVKGYESSLLTFENVDIDFLVEICTDNDRCMSILSNDKLGEDARLVIVCLDGRSRLIEVFKGFEYNWSL